MKIAFSLATIAALMIPALAAASIDVNLKYGERGTEVVELQNFLISKGLLSGSPTGNFFSLTQKAVIAYQSSADLPPTGYVGPKTRGVINADLTNAAGAQAEIAETGTTTPPVASSPTDLLKQQVALLMQQIQVLQQQASTTNQILQAQQQTQNTLQQTQQSVQQIQQNTTPTPPTPPPPPVQVVKDLAVSADKTSVQLTNYNSVNISATYTENGNPYRLTFLLPHRMVR